MYVLVMLLASCTDDKEVTTALGISRNELTVVADGGKFQLDVEAGGEWVASCDKEWCMLTPSNGVGNAVCEIRVDSSYLYSEREAHLTFRSGNRSRMLTVRQFGYEKVIRLDKSELEVADFTDYDAMFENVKVETNVNYDILVEYADLSRAGWLTVKKQTTATGSIPREGIVRIEYQMYMDSDQDRVAYVTFRQNDAKDGETPVEAKLTVRQKHAREIIPSREGDSLALLALSRIMHISEAWDVSQPMIYWKNVSMRDVTYYNAKLGKTITEPRVVKVSFSMFETDEGIPYQVRYLDQLEELYFTANANAHLKHIDLGEHVCQLRKLKVLSLMGYGLTSLPAAMKEMTSLEELELSGNNFTQIPMDIISTLDRYNLWYVNMANNRRRDVFARLYENRSVRDTLGLHGALPEALFRLKNIKYIGLSYNYLEGEVPDMGYDASEYATLKEKVEHNPVMPQLEQLSINLNYFTGNLPDWILYHPNLRCWDPYTLVFNQYESSRDSNGRKTGFGNEPASVEQACTLWSNDEDNGNGNDKQESFLYNRQNTFNRYLMYQTLLGDTNRN